MVLLVVCRGSSVVLRTRGGGFGGDVRCVVWGGGLDVG